MEYIGSIIHLLQLSSKRKVHSNELAKIVNADVEVYIFCIIISSHALFVKILCTLLILSFSRVVNIIILTTCLGKNNNFTFCEIYRALIIIFMVL